MRRKKRKTQSRSKRRKMPARFDSMNSPLVREPVVSNGASYIIDDDVVISGFSGWYFIVIFIRYTVRKSKDGVAYWCGLKEHRSHVVYCGIKSSLFLFHFLL